MTPTQAQIEAADAQMQFLGEIDGKNCYWAKPGVFTRPGFYFWDGKANVHVPITAAAEVGPDRDRVVWTDDDAERFIDETIERCAQVAEDYPDKSYKIHNGIAAAIRTLKDKPWTLTDQEKRMMQRMENSIAATPTQAQIEAEQFTQYRRKQIAELRPYRSGELMDGISISLPDKEAGSPKVGDMIARNPKNHADKWLVAAQYFADNFEPSALTVAAEVGEDGFCEECGATLPSHKRNYKTGSPVDAAIAATIERCAQVADRWRFFRVARLIAAAIRALKDKP